MRCQTMLFLLALTASALAMLPQAHANPFILMNPMYFKTATSGAYIYFPARQNFSEWNFDGAKNNFNNSIWVTTTKTITINAWFEDNWLNYTVAGAGTQQVHNGTKPSSVFLDGVNKTEGDGWTYSSGTVEVTAATTSAVLLWGTITTPPLAPSPTDAELIVRTALLVVIPTFFLIGTGLYFLKSHPTVENAIIFILIVAIFTAAMNSIVGMV